MKKLVYRMSKNLTDLSESFPKWEFFVDTGGTFTDCLGRGPDGNEVRVKVLSRGSLSAKVVKIVSSRKILLGHEIEWPENFPKGFTISAGTKNYPDIKVEHWNEQENILVISAEPPKKLVEGEAIQLFSGWEAPLLAMRLILAREKINRANCQIRMRLATTRCTNALLEDSGKKPVLFITEGFSDLLKIGDQRRTELFDLIPQKRRSFAGPCLEVNERIDRNGRVMLEPKLPDLLQEAKILLDKGHKVAVVSFLNSYLNNENEKKVIKELEEIGYEKIIGSSEIYPFINWLPRCESTVLEGYLHEILDQYLRNIISGLGQNSKLLIMNSAGGLVVPSQYRAIDSLLSGPAGGVVGACFVGKRAGLNKIINLDMGGTSTDVSRFSNSLGFQKTLRVGDAKLAGVALDIETVAAGGGSICKFENGRLKVGPESAGAFPGPACYGFGGPLCLTDVNLLLGRLDKKSFPTPILVEGAEEKLEYYIKISGLSRKELLSGFISVANESMARAIRKISVEQGYDPVEHALVSFGGAGGQHACGVAEKLGINQILSPADSGLLSAYGLSMARIERVVEKAVHEPINSPDLKIIEDKLFQLGLKQMGEMKEYAKLVRKTAFVRMKGQELGLELDYYETAGLKDLYEDKFKTVFGYSPGNKMIEIYSLRFHLACPDIHYQTETFGEGKTVYPEVNNIKSITHREELREGSAITGPCLIVDSFGTLWLQRGWTAVKGSKGSLLLKLDKLHQKEFAHSAVQYELFASRFYCVVEEMGAQLKRTAISVNVRERLDFSCALLDQNGYLVANAPHIPVHLGALGLCVRHSIKVFKEIHDGDIFITNHPGYGGSHLPDITVIAPVFDRSGKILCFLANRAHHSEIGGISPGSMPARSTNLGEEGVVIPPMRIFQRGQSKLEEIIKLLKTGNLASRQPAENMADLSAQVASLRRGIKEILTLESEHSAKIIKTHMHGLRLDSHNHCKSFLSNWGDCVLRTIQNFDDGDQLILKLSIKNGRATFDFTGTSSVRADNLNATEAITMSAICYCLRALINKDLPLNEGLLEPVTTVIPEGSLLSPVFPDNPVDCPGVAGGNVEVSQKLVDLILSAFDRVACSQGTMNNITFGNQSYSHYETIGGGAGAKVGQNGTSAVQVHMTNTAITDPEILESRFPVRLLSFKIRTSSGGSGTWSGGDGIEREYLFEEESTLNLLTQNRRQGAQGIAGGDRGKPGEQIVIRKNGDLETLPSVDSLMMNPGDRLIIRTPGGGGAGNSELLA